MEIDVTKPAFQWFKEEFNLQQEDYMRIFVRYGGCGDFQKGFSLGLMKEEPKHNAIQTEIEGVTFYIEEEDLWYFNDTDIKIKYSRNKEEIEFVHG
ncbi:MULTISPECIES: HesB/YadR/YfhF family protein [Bacillaceae]|uniref:HesB/YadR/YfhF family protein n=1 Tax=Bacillaceae TaxID=186817 RepID=UPI00047A4480|nr:MULTISPECIES: HesB/YadR/YfhF family protein [Bacillaceae]UOE92610.1 HesB/YadR/YfhF family protein [Alkalihalobacillus sp. LMS39]